MVAAITSKVLVNPRIVLIGAFLQLVVRRDHRQTFTKTQYFLKFFHRHCFSILQFAPAANAAGNGHLHHVHGDHVDEHVIEVTSNNPDRCTPKHRCAGHEKSHKHGPDCGHEAVPHGGHTDYLVDGHLHHPHGDHYDDHGPLPLA